MGRGCGHKNHMLDNSAKNLYSSYINAAGERKKRILASIKEFLTYNRGAGTIYVRKLEAIVKE